MNRVTLLMYSFLLYSAGSFRRRMITTDKPQPCRISLRAIAEFSIAGVCGLVFAFVALFFCVEVLSGKTAGMHDFVAYWATGQQLVHHANPYDGAAMLRIERSAGLPAQYGAFFMRNPPYGLWLSLPLGFVGLRVAAALWSLLLLTILVASVHMLWVMNGRPRNHLHLLGYSFGPALACLIVGQTSLFALLGLVLFLRLHRKRPFLAGVSLALCALKPHLFLAFGVVLLTWVFVSKSYNILAGAAVAIASSCALVFCIDPMAWIQYSQMMRTSGMEREFIPCLGVVLRLWINPHAVWLQYLPTALGCAWALRYFWVRRYVWDWMKHGSLLMLVSILAAPYSWLFDQALAIPALLRGAYLTRSRALLGVLAIASALIQIEMLSPTSLASAVNLWTAPAWLAWYLAACSTAGNASAKNSGLAPSASSFESVSPSCR